jgi:NTE family protein
MSGEARLPAELRIGLALGGGGAKGLAHIVALEAFDQAGVRPACISGTSIGAIIGAAYAAGYSARAIREHALRSFRDRADVMTKVFKARVGSLTDIFSGGFANAVQVDGETLLKEFWPPSMPDRFSDLRLPFTAVATDFYGRSEAVFSRGSLRTAVAASMAIPGLVRPVAVEGRLHIDGAATNPLPLDHMPVPCDLILAVDVIGGPDGADASVQPSVIEATLGAAQIMQAAIVAARHAGVNGRVRLIRPNVAGFGALDFFAARRILQAAEPIRREIQEALSSGVA